MSFHEVSLPARPRFRGDDKGRAGVTHEFP